MQNDNGNLDRILKEIKQKGSKKEAEDYLMKQLSPTQSEKLQAVLQDENAMQNLLKTPQAQALLNKLLEGTDGQHS